jgi:hypothetical protein
VEDIIKDGYARVSDILRPWNDFSNVPEEILARKQRIGTDVHEAIYLHNECMPMIYTTLREDAGGYFVSFLEWSNLTGARVVFSEVRLYDEVFKITGKYDALVRFPDEDCLVMVDWKTSSSYNKDMGNNWALQGGFYHYLMKQNDLPNISERFLFVQLDAKGGLPKVREFHFDTNLMSDCMAHIQCYRYHNPI